MLFTYRIKIPANTAKTSPKRVSLTVRQGIITRISVYIPPGHAGTAYLQIRDGETPIVPEPPAEAVSGDGTRIETRMWHVIHQPYYELTAVGWNTSTRYAHEFFVYIDVLPPELANPWAPIAARLEHLIQLFKAFWGL